MDLTSVPSTKRVRSKSAAAATKPAVKPAKTTVSAKAPRSRKKTSEAVGDSVLSQEQATITSTAPIDAGQLNAMIATAAYYLAVQRDFAPGNEMSDWLTAEQQVLRSLD